MTASLRRRARRELLLVYAAVFGATIGQQMLFPVLPPLVRELGLPELALGVVITVSATVVVAVSPWWGRRTMAWGHRTVLVTCLLGCSVAQAGFAVAAQTRLAGLVAVPVVFVLALLTRGLLFGTALAAAPVAAQAYVASVTTGEAARVKGMAGIGAATGLALVLGPAAGGLLAGGGLLVPLYVAAAVAAVAALVVGRLLPRPGPADTGRRSPRLSPLDPRVWPFLACGFGLYLPLGFVLVTVGFLVQDRLGIAPEQTAQLTGVALLGAGLAILAAQAVIVPRLGWPPLRLIRAGVPLAVAAFGLLVAADSIMTITAALAVLGLGLGLAIPGYTAAPTLTVTSAEQGAVAGLVGATNAATFVVGPLAGTALYSLDPRYPALTSAALLIALLAFVWLHPGVRQLAHR